jgi:O-antigen ligase
LAHPHESYLEMGAMGGVFFLLLFLAILGMMFARALTVLRLAGNSTRAMLAGILAMVVTLSANSFAINGWTLGPLATYGWLLLGVAASPLLAMHLRATQRQQAETIVLEQPMLNLPNENGGARAVPVEDERVLLQFSIKSSSSSSSSSS